MEIGNQQKLGGKLKINKMWFDFAKEWRRNVSMTLRHCKTAWKNVQGKNKKTPLDMASSGVNQGAKNVFAPLKFGGGGGN